MAAIACFLIGFALLIGGVALYSVEASLIVAGITLICLSVIYSIGGD